MDDERQPIPGTDGLYYTTEQVARLLGVTQVSVRRWRCRNKTAGKLVAGPPYEYHGRLVTYPAGPFLAWCRQVRMVNGVIRRKVPVTAQPGLGAQGGQQA